LKKVYRNRSDAVKFELTNLPQTITADVK